MKNEYELKRFKTCVVYPRVISFWIYTTVSFFKIFSSSPCVCVKILNILNIYIDIYIYTRRLQVYNYFQLNLTNQNQILTKTTLKTIHKLIISKVINPITVSQKKKEKEKNEILFEETHSSKSLLSSPFGRTLI